MAQANDLKPNVQRIVQHYKQLLAKSKIDFKSIYVFGSQVSGKAKPWSDIDVCVVSDNFSQDRHQKRVDLMNARDDKTLDIEPHPLHPDDFSDIHDTLAQEVKKWGVEA